MRRTAAAALWAASRPSKPRVASAVHIWQPCRPMTSSSSSSSEKTKYYFTQLDAPYTKGKHRSNALELIEKQDVIEVKGDMAICDGGGGVLGHPLEYVKIGYRDGKPARCIYCGLRFRSTTC